MNMKKYILGLAVLAGGLFASCDKDNVSTIYNSSYQNISFETDGASITTKSSTASVPVRITRSNTAGEYTAHYTLTSEENGIFTDKNGGTATFAAGEWSTIITIDVANMKGGTLYKCNLALSEADALSADTIVGTATNTEMEISVMCDYNWVSLGQGMFTSNMFGDAWPVEVMKAEGVQVYKLVSVYDNGLDMTLKIDADNHVWVEAQHVWNHSSYGKAYAVGDATGERNGLAGTYDPATNTITIAINLYVSAGSFGTEIETLQLP